MGNGNHNICNKKPGLLVAGWAWSSGPLTDSSPLGMEMAFKVTKGQQAPTRDSEKLYLPKVKQHGDGQVDIRTQLQLPRQASFQLSPWHLWKLFILYPQDTNTHTHTYTHTLASIPGVGVITHRPSREGLDIFVG
jgi:hypothetical protein